jgi:hypothetical protein
MVQILGFHGEGGGGFHARIASAGVASNSSIS